MFGVQPDAYGGTEAFTFRGNVPLSRHVYALPDSVVMCVL